MKLGPDGLLYVAGGRTKPAPPHETADRPGGVYVLTLEGKLVDLIRIPDDEVTNCAFGGPDGKTLFITAGGNLWTVRR
jgi:sugar lactone lactonase YvrE